MNFIETLRSVSGVKPCQTCRQVYTPGYIVHDPDMELCRDCHGTGTVIDLAPLLAKPKELEEFAGELLCCLWETETSKQRCDTSGNKSPRNANTGESFRIRVCECLGTARIYIVGPQRAHSLVYEIARQLGGTAVVAEKHTECALGEEPNYSDGEESSKKCIEETVSYHLSLPIPPDATVLFVTDRVDEKEMRGVAEAVNRLDGVLPYMLCLVSHGGEEMAEARCVENRIIGSKILKIISLHQERP